MKILHTADWHLGNSFHGHDRIEEHRHFLSWLIEVLRERMPDVLIIAGDVYDTPNPAAIAEQMLFDFLLQATENVPGLQIVLTAGNHDSAGRIEAPAELLKRHNIYVRGTIHRVDEDPDFDYYLLPLSRRNSQEAEVVCIALPYLRSCDYPAGMSTEEGIRYYYDNCMRRLRKSPFKGLPVISAAHFYAAGAAVCNSEHSERLVVGGQDCVDAEITACACYTALGHIHKAQRVVGKSEAHYAGSVLPMSFAEKHYDHGVQCVEVNENGLQNIVRLNYSPLRSLLTIPEHGAATTGQVLEAIGALPRRQKNDDGSDWPYLEIRVLETQPEPSFVTDVNNALADRAVRLCRIVRELPEVRQHTHENPSVQQLSAMTPREMADSVFQHRYGNPMPQSLARRFEEAEAQAIHTPDE